MRLAVSLKRLWIRVGGFPIRLVLNRASATRCRSKWLRLVREFGRNVLGGVRSNSIANIAVALSIVNFGLLVWQVWPEGTTTTPSSEPAAILETSLFAKTTNAKSELENRVDDTAGRIIELENRIRDLSLEQQFQIDRLQECINFPSPFGCH